MFMLPAVCARNVTMLLADRGDNRKTCQNFQQNADATFLKHSFVSCLWSLVKTDKPYMEKNIGIYRCHYAFQF